MRLAARRIEPVDLDANLIGQEHRVELGVLGKPGELHEVLQCLAVGGILGAPRRDVMAREQEECTERKLVLAAGHQKSPRRGLKRLLGSGRGVDPEIGEAPIQPLSTGREIAHLAVGDDDAAGSDQIDRRHVLMDDGLE